ncbi:MAG: hypothetical protein NWF09_04630 [Candidatus Bathyarchaeota archaeon]|nr:hypothetical protein [Candidatus Bathyarchaeota archaeon]
MGEYVVSLEMTEAYAHLRAILLRKGCKIIAEEPPTSIYVQHGSLWGISPETAKKTLCYHLSQSDSGTCISYSSSLSSDWKNLTVIGSALAVIMMAFCWWISVDLEVSIAAQMPSYWSWIATVDGHVDYQALQMFLDLVRVLAVFLVIVIALEVVIAVYVHLRIDVFAEENLRAL